MWLRMLIWFWSPGSTGTVDTMSRVASLPLAHPALPLAHLQGGKSRLGWDSGAAAGSTGSTGVRWAPAELRALLCAPGAASSRRGAADPACWEHRVRGQLTLPQQLWLSGQLWPRCASLLLQPGTLPSSRAPAGTPQLPTCSHTVGPILSISTSPALPPSLPLSASTSNELLIAAHPIKRLLRVNNSWLWLAGRLCSTRAGAWVNREE